MNDMTYLSADEYLRDSWRLAAAVRNVVQQLKTGLDYLSRIEFFW